MTECACLYDSGDGDQPSFHTREWRKARKPHVCCECHRTIVPGASYEHFSGKWDSRMAVYKTCEDCQNIRASLYCDSGWTFFMLWEDVTEQIFRETGLTIECIDKLTTMSAKQYLQQRWMEFLEV